MRGLRIVDLVDWFIRESIDSLNSLKPLKSFTVYRLPITAYRALDILGIH